MSFPLAGSRGFLLLSTLKKLYYLRRNTFHLKSFSRLRLYPFSIDVAFLLEERPVFELEATRNLEGDD